MCVCGGGVEMGMVCCPRMAILQEEKFYDKKFSRLYNHFFGD